MLPDQRCDAPRSLGINRPAQCGQRFCRRCHLQRLLSARLWGRAAYTGWILEKPEWAHKLTPRDFAALTPLIWEHVNPYGRFELDMNTRLPLQ